MVSEFGDNLDRTRLDYLRETVRALYGVILGADPSEEALDRWVAVLKNRGEAAGAVAITETLLKGREFEATAARDIDPLGRGRGRTALTRPFDFRIPRDLRVTETRPDNVLIVGSCLTEGLAECLREQGVNCDFLLFNYVAELSPPRSIQSYDFQIVQIAARSLLPETAYFGLIGSPEAYGTVFEETVARLELFLQSAMRWNKEFGLLTFVANFLVPQQNPLGRMVAGSDRRNMTRLFNRLNEHLDDLVREYRHAYILDYDGISASFGRRYVQDDVIAQFNHCSMLGVGRVSIDHSRIEDHHSADELYEMAPEDVLAAIADEALAMHRTVSQVDAVKLVIVDLDDTLWRGVAAENWQGSTHATEGYPLGLAEALLYLKARGIILAIVSKNDENRIRELWDSIWLDRLKMEDFAVRKINWEPKERNVESIIRDVNVLPSSVLFIDDNPVERAAVAAAFPGVRVLGAEPYLLRRILLWSPETQVSFITAESSRRTEMIQGQVNREASRSTLSREEFLASLDVRIDQARITTAEHEKFLRCVELINKTNQFNTTGKKLTPADAVSLLESGGVLYAFDVRDKFVEYGIVGVAVVRGNWIEQFAMSCRVIGLGVETRAIDAIVGDIARSGAGDVVGKVWDTGKNHLCLDLFERCGFSEIGGSWTRQITAAEPAIA